MNSRDYFFFCFVFFVALQSSVYSYETQSNIKISRDDLMLIYGWQSDSFIAFYIIAFAHEPCKCLKIKETIAKQEKKHNSKRWSNQIEWMKKATNHLKIIIILVHFEHLNWCKYLWPFVCSKDFIEIENWLKRLNRACLMRGTKKNCFSM